MSRILVLTFFLCALGPILALGAPVDAAADGWTYVGDWDAVDVNNENAVLAPGQNPSDTADNAHDSNAADNDRAASPSVTAAQAIDTLASSGAPVATADAQQSSDPLGAQGGSVFIAWPDGRFETGRMTNGRIEFDNGDVYESRSENTPPDRDRSVGASLLLDFSPCPDAPYSNHGMVVERFLGANMNQAYPGTMQLQRPGSFIEVSFDCSEAPRDMVLSLTHFVLDAPSSGAEQGAGINVHVNGQPAFHEQTPLDHSARTDSWAIGQRVKQGRNVVRIEAGTAGGMYCLQRLEIRPGR